MLLQHVETKVSLNSMMLCSWIFLCIDLMNDFDENCVFCFG